MIPFNFESINQITQKQIKSDLFPVLRKKENFDLFTVKSEVMAWLEEVLRMENQEEEYLHAFIEKSFRPELLFDSEEILARIQNHPVVLWKLLQKQI